MLKVYLETTIFNRFLEDNFENQLDAIRIKLYEETKEMDKKDIIKNVNFHAQNIAQEFGIKIESTINEKCFQTITTLPNVSTFII